MLHLSKSFQIFIANTKEQSKISDVIYKIGTYKSDEFRERRNIITDAEINYITNRQDGTISYLPEGKEHIVTDNGTWSKQGRQNGKPAKVIRKIFAERFLRYLKDSDFETFANLYKASFSLDGYDFKVVNGEKIADVYTMQRAEGEASLNNSCMRSMSKDTFDIYTHCEQCSIVRLTNRWGQLAGRALLWEVDGKHIMDRIYVAEEHLYEAFLAYAKTNGYWTKKDYKSYSDKTTFICPETGEQKTLILKVDTDTDFDQYPYIDTFCYGDDGFLSNSNPYSYRFTYNGTSGDREDTEAEDDDEMIYCQRHGESYRPDDVTYVDRGVYADTYLPNDETVCVNGDRYWIEDEDIVEIDGDYYHKVDCRFSTYEDEYIHEDDCFFDELEEDYFYNHEAVEIDGQKYWDGSDNICADIDGKYQLKDNCTEFIDVNGRQYFVHENNLTTINGQDYHIHPTAQNLVKFPFPLIFNPTI